MRKSSLKLRIALFFIFLVSSIVFIMELGRNRMINLYGTTSPTEVRGVEAQQNTKTAQNNASPKKERRAVQPPTVPTTAGANYNLSEGQEIKNLTITNNSKAIRVKVKRGLTVESRNVSGEGLYEEFEAGDEEDIFIFRTNSKSRITLSLICK